MKKEYCGLFGIYGNKEAARMTYFGLYALQHRGQESAGIVTWDGEKIREQKGMGLVADVFNERHLSKELRGDIAMGHIRYSTTGASLIRNAQPFIVRHGDLRLAVAHNGNLVNTFELRTELENNGSIFHDWQKTVLLGFVKAMNLINKQKCGFTVAASQFSAFKYFFQLSNAGKYS